MSLASAPEGSSAGAGSVATNNDILLDLRSPINELKKTAQFINTLQDATLEQSNMRQDDIDRLCAAEPDPSLNVTNKHFMALEGWTLNVFSVFSVMPSLAS